MEGTFWGPDFAALERDDPEIAAVLLGELARQRVTLNLVASESPTSPAVLAALGSTLANKYAEGYPGQRYYGGCEQVDRAEELAVQRARELFGADHANVQPHSGASANLAAYAALAEPGDPVLAMGLPHGGHLTHGSRANFSGRWFHPIAYHVDPDTEEIDYDEVRELSLAHQPKLIICGAMSYPRLIDFARFRRIADEVGAYLMVDAAHFIGLVAGRAVPSPVPYADVVTSTTHKALRGPRGGLILCRSELAQRIDKAVFPFAQGGPMMHAVAAKAVAFREASRPAFRAYAEQVVRNARELVAALAEEGMRPVAGGTDTHLAVLDLRALGVSGRDAEQRCERAGISVNRNVVPYDPVRPAIASGIRIGTPAVTTQGMAEPEMRRIALLLATAVRADPGTPAGADALTGVRDSVRELAGEFPAYLPELVTTR
ncbi:serine hydroxymethyltransferase [Actinoplanes sp. G11-F43]|uniref:serine hydroxymethyltransferase n=1 Tax=Actinoplanes sp. G11-F43 TaxID=3424130 RepID=UPI003D32F3EB